MQRSTTGAAKAAGINAALVVVAVSACLLLAEGLARAFLDPVDFLQVELVPDPVLGHLIGPGSGGHDDWGFRNPGVPSRADVVAIGDSLTYGVAATASTAWPSQLAERIHKSVYNMGLGGYGPLQYLHLFETKALRLGPSQIVVALFFGNDFMDAYNVAYSNPTWAPYRKREELAEPVGRVFLPVEAKGRPLSGLRDWLARTSLIYRLATQSPAFDFQREREASRETGVIRLALGDSYTFVNPTRVLRLMDAEDPRIIEAVDITERALLEMRGASRRRGIDLVVLLIPTKELVFADVARPSLGASDRAAYDRLVSSETKLRGSLLATLSAGGIEHVDVLDALKAAAPAQNIYPFNDVHPNAAGYRIIAAEVARGLAPRER